ETERLDRRAVGTASPAAATAEVFDRASRQRPPHGDQRYPLGAADRKPVALPPRALRLLEDGLQPLLSVAEGGDLGPGPVSVAAAGGRGGAARLDAPLRRQHRRPGAPARRRGKGGGSAAEALGRSRGGFTTKVHLRCERSGKPMVVVL
ncbi:MAG: Mobile element protein, partial [uncultured Thermomicrobiales bacterium]